MKKIQLIITREYLTRVRKRTFIIATLLFPLLYLALIFGTGYIAQKTKQSLKIALIDSSGLFKEELIKGVNGNDTSNTLTLIKDNYATVLKSYDSVGYNGCVVIPEHIDWKSADPNVLNVNTKKTYGAGSLDSLQKRLNIVWLQIKNDSMGIDGGKQKILNAGIYARFTKAKDSGSASLIGYICGFLMYLILLLYGSQVMMGVTEEKTNRIAEVVVSSVKPFQLMLGKIIGIAMVALTQFILWIAFIFIVYNFTKGSPSASGNMSGMVGQIQDVFTSVNMPLVVGCFIFYMLAGFFFYSSLYAAIGSAINEDMREAQSLSFPITMLVIFSIALMGPTITNPSSPVAVWASIIPFSSPIVMMSRIPFGVPSTVPLWQLGLSMVLLIAGFLFTTWFAARIYRTGILMYGKKPSWKELIKWAFRKS